MYRTRAGAAARILSVRLLAVAIACLAWCLPAFALADGIRIAAIEPTPFFPRRSPGEALRQVVRLKLENDGAMVEARVRIRVADQRAYEESLGRLEPKESVKNIHIPEVVQPTEVSVELLTAGTSTPAAGRTVTWQPQKQWKVYCVAYSHHDLGFGDYPHRLRTTIRHANIARPLQFCRDTDDWDDDSRFRFVIETSEPITSFLAGRPREVAEELGRRIREGRIQLGAAQNTVNTEQMSHEGLARLFYLANRHTRDLLAIPKCRTAVIDDVIGLTWPLASFCAEAEIPYFFHGSNITAHCFGPASLEPVFYWQGPVPGSRVLTRATLYGGYAGDNPGDVSDAHIQAVIQKYGANLPYDALILQEGTDFQLVTMETAKRIRAWNERWAYPRMICATMDMYFDDIVRQVQSGAVKSFAGDSNNEWADQDSTDAAYAARARRLGESIPTAEKLATIAQIVAGGGNSWTDLYQAYHRLLEWHEHTNAIDYVAHDLERVRRYETELEENHEMVRDAEELSARAQASALQKLSTAITRESERSLIIFNPLTRPRTDTVRLERGVLALGDHIFDPADNREVRWQVMPDGGVVFVATNVPPLGYKTFAVRAGEICVEPSVTPSPDTLESAWFRVTFDATTGTITGILDKRRNLELVDRTSPHRFNEYLYERFETSDWTGPTTWHRVKTATLKNASGPVAQTMQVTASAVGVESLTQTVVLYADLPRIDFVLDMIKSPSGRHDGQPNTDPRGKEALFVALPLAVSEPRIRHELPGCVSEPVQDLFDGANTAFYAVRHFSDVSNERYGVTLSTPDSSLFQYDRPRSTPINSGGEANFEMHKAPVTTGRTYLYLMNNMFDVNIRWSQAGPARFAYSMQSHDGDWRQGQADQFGWEVMSPLVAIDVRGKNRGPLPATDSFAAVDQSNVACTTFKSAEANGTGFILRFVETQGRQTAANISLPLLAPIASATLTNLVEDDRPEPLVVESGKRVTLNLPPYGVKTIRVIRKTPAPALVRGLAARAVADMRIELSWDTAGGDTLSHYHVYRGTAPDFTPSLLSLVQRPAGNSCADQPQLHSAGWINNGLEPATTYYYRVAAVDRWNHEGSASPPVAVTTLKSSEKNLPPLEVQKLSAVLVSPVYRFNVVNLLWRTNCESDIKGYEVHRSTVARFELSDATRLAVLDARAIIKGSTEYGATSIDYPANEFDHQMYLDITVEPARTYYYRVRAVDTAGQKGPCSNEATATTRMLSPSETLLEGISAQSVFATQYSADLAIDGVPDPFRAWISKPYGGGTREQPLDVWWAFEFPASKRLMLSGVRIIGDRRAEIPLQKKLQVQARLHAAWKNVGSIADATEKDLVIRWPDPVETDAIRIFVPAADLPQSARADVDGIVRICELSFLFPDGKEAAPREVFATPDH